MAAPTANPSSLAQPAFCRHSPEVGAVCGKAARTVLCGGRSAMSVPTATEAESRASDVLRCLENRRLLHVALQSPDRDRFRRRAAAGDALCARRIAMSAGDPPAAGDLRALAAGQRADGAAREPFPGVEPRARRAR